MGGSHNIRGTKIQTILCLIQILDCDDLEYVILEPNNGNTCVDIYLKYLNKSKVIQVKSSDDPFNKTEVSNVANQMQKISSDEFELILVGTNFGTIRDNQLFGKVRVKLKCINVAELMPLTVYYLVKYLEKKGKILSLETGDLLASYLVNELDFFSIKSLEITPGYLDKIIEKALVNIKNGGISVEEFIKSGKDFETLLGFKENDLLRRKMGIHLFKHLSIPNKLEKLKEAWPYLEIQNDKIFANKSLINCLNVIFIAVFAVIVSSPGFYFMELSLIYLNWKALILGMVFSIMYFGVGILMLSTIRPFIQALMLGREICLRCLSDLSLKEG